MMLLPHKLLQANIATNRELCFYFGKNAVLRFDSVLFWGMLAKFMW